MTPAANPSPEQRLLFVALLIAFAAIGVGLALWFWGWTEPVRTSL